MKVRATSEKFRSFREALKQATENEEVKAKRVAKVVGKAISLQPALGPIIQLLTHSAQSKLAAAVDKWGWSTKLRLSKEATEELNELSENMEEMNGQTICNNATAVTLESILGPVSQLKRSPPRYTGQLLYTCRERAPIVFSRGRCIGISNPA